MLDSADSEFPRRFEPVAQLGKGGGGEVWEARDRVTGQTVALKLLRVGANEAEMLALVREATVLSGVEGLGVPRVLHFGRLPKTDRAYLARELVQGTSLAELIDEGGDPALCLSAVAQAADLITRLHRALLLHGDIKPANIIVSDDGTATLVDLGLAAHWQEGGTKPEGLTPRYAAPELFRGEPLTPQAEVYALGASTHDVLQRVGSSLDANLCDAVRKVIGRATEEEPGDRYPSADEFAEALRSSLRLESEPRVSVARAWSIVGIDHVTEQLLEAIAALQPGAGLVVAGPPGSGRSTLLRRASWSLGVRGAAVSHVEPRAAGDLAAALDMVLPDDPGGTVLVVDDADRLDQAELDRLGELRQAGCTLVVAAGAEGVHLPGATFGLFMVPPRSPDDTASLVRRMIPSLSDALVDTIVRRTGARPGPLRELITGVEGAAVVSVSDLDDTLDDGAKIAPADIHRLLDRGRFEQAARQLEAWGGDAGLPVAIARAKLAVARGEPKAALAELKRVQDEVDGDEEGWAAMWHVQKARAHLRSGDYEEAEKHAGLALQRMGASLLGELAATGAPSAGAAALGPMIADALSVCGVTQSLSARHDEAATTLRRAVDVARATRDDRILAVPLGKLAIALQRNDKHDEAVTAHEEALIYAERAGDAGSIATSRLNLAGIAKTRGDMAGAIAHFEAAVDMGRRSGRQSTVRQALLNLANLDLYLGRGERAQASIDALAEERGSLPVVARAQLLALEAESAGLRGDLGQAADKCLACADAYEELGRPVDAAEALLERVLMLAQRGGEADPAELQEQLFRAEALLADSGAHRPLLLLARGHVALLAGAAEQAREAFDEAIDAAEGSGQREWLWRALEQRSGMLERGGDAPAAATDRHSALGVLQDIAGRLPRDLAEVYWNDPRRRALRSQPVQSQPRTTVRPTPTLTLAAADMDGPTQIGTLLGGDKLARILEVNRQIAGEYDLERLLERVTDHAVALLRAERGFVLLRSKSSEERLSVHAMRDTGGAAHAEFSRSIAERVVQSGEPFVAADAVGDARVSDYVSVHALMLRSVACVPIRNRSGRAIGALYLETRVRPGIEFAAEIPILVAMADQVAIAIETARLVSENQERADELEKANIELEAARQKLEQNLGRRTEQLQSTRRDLRTAREMLRGHFGYQGIVGTAPSMRRVYSIIERVKDADVPLLITGESGTGKEVIARAVHAAGVRAKQKLVGVNCGAIPEHLLESELFGHVRGAFTGADRDKKGLFRELSQGTILLDEIGEMPHKMQAGLLRVLQEKVVRPVGGSSEEKVDTRVITATHRDLSAMVKAGTFREDLFYRLNVIEIRVPALRERREDIPLLIDHFLRIFAARYKRERCTVSREALKRLSAYDWPGNVRQLENVLLNAWILADEPELPPDAFELPAASATAQSPAAPPVRPVAESLGDRRQQEKDRILEALAACNWNRAKAAQLVGMPRRTFYRRLEKYGIQ